MKQSEMELGKMTRVLITGGTGFVGHWLKVRSFYQNKDLELITLSHKQYDDMEWFNGYYDYIIHAAHVTPVPAIVCANNCNARFLYISSGAVYHEELNEYGKQKKWFEELTYMSGLNYSIARLFTFCGYELKWDNFAVGTFIRNSMNFKPINIWGDGSMVRSYMYGSDLGDWLWKILFDGEPDGIYNVGSPVPTTMLELAKEVRSNFDHPTDVYIENRGEKEQAHIYLPEITEKEINLGLQIKVPFKQAIKRAIEDYVAEKVI